MHGAGGTQGGSGRFFMGLIMLIVGGYMLLNSIKVSNGFAMGKTLYATGAMGGFSGLNITGGMILVPFIFGIGMIFYNAKSIIGWVLTLGSLASLVFGVITSLKFTMASMTGFEILTILVLTFGGLGLFLSSLRSIEKNKE